MDTDDFKKKINNKLYFAVATGEHNDIPELIRQGDDIISRRHNQRSSDCCRSLSSFINAQDEDGMTALMWLAVGGHLTPELAKILILGGPFQREEHPYKKVFSALIQLAAHGHLTPELLDVFVDHGVDIHTRNKLDMTVLTVSAESANLTTELLRAFMKHGVNLEDTYKHLQKESKLTPELDAMFSHVQQCDSL